MTRKILPLLIAAITLIGCGKKETVVQPEPPVVRGEGSGGIFVASADPSTNYVGNGIALQLEVTNCDFWNIVVRYPIRSRVILKTYDRTAFENVSGGFVLRYTNVLSSMSNFMFYWSSSRETTLPVTVEAWNILGQAIQSETYILRWIKDESADNYFSLSVTPLTNENYVSINLHVAILKSGFDSLIVESTNWSRLSNVIVDRNFRSLYMGLVSTNRKAFVNKDVLTATFNAPDFLTLPVNVRAIDADGSVIEETNIVLKWAEAYRPVVVEVGTNETEETVMENMPVEANDDEESHSIYEE
jgi:hypothetical protein